jgi:hypothetical protein
LWTVLREEERTGLSVIAGEEVGFDEILFACFRRGETFFGNNARRGRRIRRTPFRWPAIGRR